MSALGLFHRTISEVEDAILQAKAWQAYRTAGDSAADLNRWPAVGSKVKP
ncbi:hypothetical protein EV382_1139 [Micromonospora violae]|uniref:Uncharacterized protein n=1 Tax=Micromonospora violae TaxID=1278207 RepID=A0A4Q7UF04_9ACTN|nr:hypothetical protein [Micromonospora violae]RZT77963.1 hypothetical protein EV382_1139 [Micromonospora violae]